MKADKTADSRERIRVLIVDDESLARKRIRDLFSGREEEFEIVGECVNGKKAVEAIEANSADLLFLDIQMPDMDGFEVLKKVRIKTLPAIIFVTAYDKYALQAFEVHAVDYLLKPFDDERFEEMLRFAVRQIRKDRIEDLGKKLSALIANFNEAEDSKAGKTDRLKPTDQFQKRLVIRSTGRISFVEVEDIEWIGAEGSYVSLNVNGKSHLMRGTLKKLEEQLDPRQFLRIHRSTMVNVSSIKELKPHFHGEYVVLLKNGKRLKLSRNYRENAELLIGGEI